MKRELFLYCSLVVLGCVVLLLPSSAPSAVFNSPDETSNYFFASTYAQTGQLYYEDESLAQDPHNMHHIRGVTTYEGKGTPYGFFGLSLVAGTWLALTPFAGLLLTLAFAFVGFYYLYKLVSLHVDVPYYAFFALFFLFTPYLYWSNQPFMNTLPATALFIAGIYYVQLYVRQQSSTQLLLAATFFSVAALIRNEYLWFTLLFVVLTAAFHRHAVRFTHTLAAAAVGLLLFVVPTLIVNEQLYGSPFTFGYSVFTEVNFPERVDPGAPFLDTVQRILLPEQLQIGLLIHNIYRYTAGLVPLLSLFFVLGLLALVRDKRVSLYGVCCALLVLYTVLYAGSGTTWGYDQAPTLRASTVRYWMLFYACALGVAAYLWTQTNTLTKRTTYMLCACVLVLGVSSAGVTDAASLAQQARTVNAYSEHGRTLSTLLPSDAVLITSQWDKFTPSNMTVSTWWFEENYNAAHVADDIMYWRDLGRPVYLLVDQEYVDVAAINAALAPHYVLTEVHARYRLYKVTNAQ